MWLSLALFASFLSATWFHIIFCLAVGLVVDQNLFLLTQRAISLWFQWKESTHTWHFVSLSGLESIFLVCASPLVKYDKRSGSGLRYEGLPAARSSLVPECKIERERPAAQAQSEKDRPG